METKVCPKCGRELPLSDFRNDKSKKDGKDSRCKECRKEYQKEHYKNNKERLKEKHKEYRENNKERLKEYQKEYYEKNKEKIKDYKKEYYKNNEEHYKEHYKEYREDNREKIKEHRKEYYEKNKEKIKKYQKNNKEKIKEYQKKYQENNREKLNEYRKNKIKEDELFALTIRCRSRIKQFTKKTGYKKTSKTFEMIGCTPKQLLEHLHKTWYDNYGTEYNGEPVHIDHIIPLSSAETEEDMYKLCHYTNLQYLKPEDNLSKYNSIPQTI